MIRPLTSDGVVLDGEQTKAIRKPLLELTIKGQRVRLELLISPMNSLAQM